MAHVATSAHAGTMAHDCLLVYITAPDAAVAEALCSTLVRERLAACANILEGASSLYWWQGALERASECICLLKTTAERFPALAARAREAHPYETPCIVALPLVAGDRDFLNWIRAEASGDTAD